MLSIPEGTHRRAQAGARLQLIASASSISDAVKLLSHKWISLRSLRNVDVRFVFWVPL